jgi:short chain dehydrogenase.
MRLNGQVVLITGGSGALGQTVAPACVRQARTSSRWIAIRRRLRLQE